MLCIGVVYRMLCIGVVYRMLCIGTLLILLHYRAKFSTYYIRVEYLLILSSTTNVPRSLLSFLFSSPSTWLFALPYMESSVIAESTMESSSQIISNRLSSASSNLTRLGYTLQKNYVLYIHHCPPPPPNPTYRVTHHA